MANEKVKVRKLVHSSRYKHNTNGALIGVSQAAMMDQGILRRDFSEEKFEIDQVFECDKSYYDKYLLRRKEYEIVGDESDKEAEKAAKEKAKLEAKEKEEAEKAEKTEKAAKAEGK